MQRRTILGAGLALAVATALAPFQARAQEIDLRYAHVGAEGDIQHWYAERAGSVSPR